MIMDREILTVLGALLKKHGSAAVLSALADSCDVVGDLGDLGRLYYHDAAEYIRDAARCVHKAESADEHKLSVGPILLAHGHEE